MENSKEMINLSSSELYGKSFRAGNFPLSTYFFEIVAWLHTYSYSQRPLKEALGFSVLFPRARSLTPVSICKGNRDNVTTFLPSAACWVTMVIVTYPCLPGIFFPRCKTTASVFHMWGRAGSTHRRAPIQIPALLRNHGATPEIAVSRPRRGVACVLHCQC